MWTTAFIIVFVTPLALLMTGIIFYIHTTINYRKGHIEPYPSDKDRFMKIHECSACGARGRKIDFNREEPCPNCGEKASIKEITAKWIMFFSKSESGWYTKDEIEK